MNILLVTETYLPYISGVSSSTDSIAKYLTSRKHKIILVAPKPIIPGKIDIHKNLKIIFSTSFPDPLYKGKAMAIFPFGFFPLLKAFSQNKFDVVHIQEPGSLGITALILAKIYKVPTAGALHFIPEQIDRVFSGTLETIFTPLLNIYINFIYNKYDVIITPSHHFEIFLKKVGVKKPINVISNGVDIKNFRPTKKYPTKSVTFLFLGRLDGDKNVATLIHAMQFVDKNVRLHIVGKGKDRNLLHNLAKRLKVQNKIIWIDYVTDKEMVKLYRKADCFVIMSPYEGQSIATLQAVAVGIPVIAARAGALPELVYENKNGYLVNAYDYKTLADKMNKIAENKNLREKFGNVSREISLKHNKALVLKDLESVYNNLK